MYLFYNVGEIAASFEFNNLLGRDLNFFTALGISASTSTSLGYGERAKANEGNAVTFFQSLGGSFNESVEGFLGICLGQTSTSSNGINQLCFVHNKKILGLVNFHFAYTNINHF
jgi:hypothetical protein